MKKTILLSIIFLLGFKGFYLFKKYRNAKKLTVGIIGFRFPKLNLSNLLGEVFVSVKIGIDNFSDSKFQIKQIKLNVLDEDGNLLAYQENPMSESILLEANKKNEFPIRFLISSTMIRSLIQANGGAINIGANYITNNKYGIKLQLVGFVQAEGFTIPINEKITV